MRKIKLALFLTVISAASSIGYSQHRTVLPVPPDLKLSLHLLSPISTANNKKGDKFSCRVLSPAEYLGSTVDGYIRDLKRSGRADKESKLDLAFDTITLSDGRSEKFNASVIEVFDVVHVADKGRADNEGSVRSKSSTVKTSIKRAAVGALIGSLIGGALGGGKGAAIGAAVGASVGVTTTLAQKGPDLEFKEGTQFTVISNAPAQRKDQSAPMTGAPNASEAPRLARDLVSTSPEPPSSAFRFYRGGKVFSITIPDNWREFGGVPTVAFAPVGGFVTSQGRLELSHAVMVGTVPARGAALETASTEFVNKLLTNNTYLKRQGTTELATIADRKAIKIRLSGTPASTRRVERIFVYAVLLSNGDLFYVNTVVPADNADYYDSVFARILKSIELGDR